jgi:hypothetical protein
MHGGGEFQSTHLNHPDFKISSDFLKDTENIILSEVSLAQKTKNRMFSLICGH